MVWSEGILTSSDSNRAIPWWKWKRERMGLGTPSQNGKLVRKAFTWRLMKRTRPLTS